MAFHIDFKSNACVNALHYWGI